MKRSPQNDIPGPPRKRLAGYNRAEMGTSELAPALPASESADGGGGGAIPMDNARAYLNEVKHVLKDDKEKFVEYLEIMKDVQAKRIDAGEVITRVKDLFKGHPALILGFNPFIPQGYSKITLPVDEEQGLGQRKKTQLVQLNNQVGNNINKIKTRGAREIQTRKRKNGISGPRRLNLLASRRQAKVTISKSAAGATAYVSTVANGGGGALPMPESAVASPASVSAAGRGVAPQFTRDDALAYLQEVRDMCGDNEDKFDEYLEIMKDFKAQRIDFAEVKTRVKDFFGGHGRLINRFNKFLPKGYKITPTTKEVLLASKMDQYDLAINYLQKIKARFQTEEHVYKTFIEILNMYYKGDISAQEVCQEVSDIFTQHADLMDELQDMCPQFTSSTAPVSSNTLVRQGTANPSYRPLGNSYPKPFSTHLTELARGVLNDSWVCMAPGLNEDYSFKHIGKNRYQKNLLRCEDDQFEIDVLVEWASATARKVNDLVEYIQDTKFEQKSKFVLGDHLSAINLRCIQLIYGDHGWDTIDLLWKNPGFLPVVLVRLQQKHDEWSRLRIEMNTVWAEVYSKNYHKSLNCRR